MASTGFEPVTFAIPVRCSINWAVKPHIRSEVNLLSSYLPVQWNDVKYIWNSYIWNSNCTTAVQYEFHIYFSQCFKLRAARAACLFFFIHPIRSLFYGSFASVVVAKPPSFVFAETSILKVDPCVTLGELIQAIGNAICVIHSHCLSHLSCNFQCKGRDNLVSRTSA